MFHTNFAFKINYFTLQFKKLLYVIVCRENNALAQEVINNVQCYKNNIVPSTLCTVQKVLSLKHSLLKSNREITKLYLEILSN